MTRTKRLPARTGAPDSGTGKSARRAELLDIAAHLFATRGFLPTTVREIADAAGILSGSLYHHFDSKESMVDEILREFLDYQQATFDEVLRSSADSRTTITELIRRSFEAMEAYRTAVTIYQNESNYLVQFDRFDYLRQAAATFEDTWDRVLRRAQSEGVLRSDLDVGLVYRMVRDAVWPTVHWYDPSGPLTTEVIAEQYVTILCGGIMAERG